MKYTENLNAKFSQSISMKLLVILLLIILMQIPLSMVKGLIYERQDLQRQAQSEISQRWGVHQYIGSPLIKLSYQSTVLNKSKKYLSHSSVKPSNNANFSIDINAEVRYLGIYESSVYNAVVAIEGQMELEQMQNEGLYTLTKKQFFIPLKQLRGLKTLNKVIINKTPLTLDPIETQVNGINGFSFDLPLATSTNILTYKIEFSVAGSEQLDILALGKKTEVKMHSNWPSPSFVGNYLPDSRSISSKGFDANWKVQKLTQLQEKAVDSLDNSLINSAADFGVKIMIPANIYQVNTRTVKYSFLIIVLAFAGFFLAELFFKLKLHPFQYLLIGFSLSTFFILLLSLSEYLSFNLSYMIASMATIGLITAYCSSVLKQLIRGLFTGVLFSVLFGFIFILVKAEQTSLLMGAIGIWVVLSLIMYLTRHIDWYTINQIPEE